jgi:transketolase
LIRAAREHSGPIYFRIGRGRDPEIYAEQPEVQIGRAITHSKGCDIAVIATGSTVHASLVAAEELRAEGISVGVIDMHTVKPIDSATVLRVATEAPIILTVEEHNVLGGLGGAVAEVLAEAGTGTRLVRHGLMDEYSLIAPPTHLYAHYRLDAKGIASVVREVLR